MKKYIIIAACFIGLSSEIFAQKGVELTIKKNEESGRFEVYAKPNFSKRNFLLASSQISILLPKSVSDEKLRIYNNDGGTWEDNSNVYAPAANRNVDFHGIISMGAKTDFTEGVESLLFSFELPKEIKLSEVSLYENGIDASSSAPGMKGGDFKNSLNTAYDEEIYVKNYKFKAEQDKSVSADTKVDPNNALTVFPNITKDYFKVSLTNIDESENSTLTLSTEMGKVLLKINGTKKELEEKSYLVPSEITNQSLVVRLKTTSKTFAKRILVDRD